MASAEPALLYSFDVSLQLADPHTLNDGIRGKVESQQGSSTVTSIQSVERALCTMPSLHQALHIQYSQAQKPRVKLLFLG